MRSQETKNAPAVGGSRGANEPRGKDSRTIVRGSQIQRKAIEFGLLERTRNVRKRRHADSYDVSLSGGNMREQVRRQKEVRR